MSWSINPQYKKLENPFEEYHDIKTTQESIKQMFRFGTPTWYSHPEDYRNYVKELFAAEKEHSDELVADFQMEDQVLLTDYKARAVNIMSTKSFVEQLRENNIRCFALYNGMPQTVGLWCEVPTLDGLKLRPIAMMQTPAMVEWSILKLDNHGLPAGEEYRGWRTVLSQLIRKGILTEEKVHDIFGSSTESIVSRRYRKTLWGHRHRRENIEVRDDF